MPAVGGNPGHLPIVTLVPLGDPRAERRTPWGGLGGRHSARVKGRPQGVAGGRGPAAGAQADPALAHAATGKPLTASCLSFCTCETGPVLKRWRSVRPGSPPETVVRAAGLHPSPSHSLFFPRRGPVPC